MLVEFSVTNYRSFRDKTTLSMVAADGDGEDRRVVTVDERPAKPLRLLRSAAIYGPNASGKSNLVKALGLMQSEVVHGPYSSSESSWRVAPFYLDPNTEGAASEFEVAIHHRGDRFTYGFSMGKYGVVEEWLYAGIPRTRMLFHRRGGDVEFGRSWRGDRVALAERTATNTLLLTVSAAFNHPIAAAIRAWFAGGLVLGSGASRQVSYTLRRLLNSATYSDELQAYLQAADTAIEGVDPHSIQVSDPVDDAYVPTAATGPTHIEGAGDWYRAGVMRRTKDGSLASFDLQDDESDGTRRLLELAGPWIDTLRNGRLLLVDEFDHRLHPTLSRFLIETWHATNSRAQLILTTHNADLLEGDLFRRDQVWFMDKDRDQQSVLYSLADFRAANGRGARTSDNHRRKYLAGRYGAIPITHGVGHAEEE